MQPSSTIITSASGTIIIVFYQSEGYPGELDPSEEVVHDRLPLVELGQEGVRAELELLLRHDSSLPIVLDLIFLRFPDLELFADFEPVKKEPV